MIQIAHNATDARIINAPKQALVEINRVLSYQVAGPEHMAACRSGSWSGTSSFLTWGKEAGTGHFPAGFVPLVCRAMRKIGLEVQLISKPLPPPLGPERPEVDAFGYSERYDYQPETVEALLRHGKMIAQVATGGGKSRICRMVYRRINRPTLFLTTRGILMYQMRDAVVGMGEEVAVLGDGEWGIKYRKADGSEGRRATKFCVGMVQTLTQRLEQHDEKAELLALRQRRANQLAKIVDEAKLKLKKDGVLPHLIGQRTDELARREAERLDVTPEEIANIKVSVARHNKLRTATIEFLQRFEVVIAEEAHELSGDGFFTVMAHLKNAHYRLALTATPFMKDDEEANMRLLASCGPVAVRVTEQLLIERGILAKPYFKWLKLDETRKPKGLTRSTPWQKAYTLGIVNFEHRNKLICAELLRAKMYGLNGLVLVQHKAHGHVLKEMLTRFGMRCAFIDGDSSQPERQAELTKLANGSLDVLIGSTILDVGVDVPSIGMIVLAGGGKAEVALRQRIGRGLREKKNGLPNYAFIVDAFDEFNNHLKSHCGDRQAVIKGTPGFGENIVADFDYAGLGFSRKTA
jgi:superfamily II DNA or RNA helicase